MKIELYITTDRTGSDKVLDRMKTRLSEVAGGYTLTNATGGYTLASGELVEEPVTIISVLVPVGQTSVVLAEMYFGASWMLDLGEEAVLLVMNNEPELLRKEDFE